MRAFSNYVSRVKLIITNTLVANGYVFVTKMCMLCTSHILTDVGIFSEFISSYTKLFINSELLDVNQMRCRYWAISAHR